MTETTSVLIEIDEKIYKSLSSIAKHVFKMPVEDLMSDMLEEFSKETVENF